MLHNTSRADLVPSDFFLSQNYPNPFSGRTSIKLCLAYKTRVRLDVRDSEGTLVQTLLDEVMEPGTYEVEFDARMGEKGAANIAEGVYFCTLQAGDYTATKEMLLLRSTRHAS